MIRAANSHQNSRSNHPNVVASDAAKATTIAMPIRSIIPGWRSLASRTAPFRNGDPPYTKITVPRTGAIQSDPGKVGAVYPNQSWMVSLKKSTGRVRASDSQKRSRNIATLWPSCLSWLPPWPL